MPAIAGAHVSITPRASTHGATERYTVRIPSEGKVATIAAELDVPEGVIVETMQAPAGWKHEVRRKEEFTVSQNGLVTNIVSFNVGVEIGQLLALTAVLIGISYWRRHPGFLRHSFAANTALMTGGFILTGYQVAGYFQ